jgi:hypothetical protein
MANYGIVFCKKVLSSLQKTEDDLMAKTGMGFYIGFEASFLSMSLVKVIYPCI